eukprot:8940159-Pyramimonas_sp.AAC.1
MHAARLMQIGLDTDMQRPYQMQRRVEFFSVFIFGNLRASVITLGGELNSPVVEGLNNGRVEP